MAQHEARDFLHARRLGRGGTAVRRRIHSPQADERSWGSPHERSE